MISAHAERLPRRSTDDLSRGDAERQLIAHEMLVKQYDDEARKSLTFRPTIKQLSCVDSKLKVASDPDNYLKRVESAAQQQDRMQRMELNRRKESEMSECTFKPRIRESPQFVKRIATSVRRSGSTGRCPSDSASQRDFRF